MNLYERLRVPGTASQLEIDRAYQQMVKEAGYDPSINRKELEAAYRTLGDPTKRALYDAGQLEERKKKSAAEKVQLKVRKDAAAEKSRPVKLAIGLAVLLLLGGLYFPWRFSHRFQTFAPGDTLIMKSNGQYYGKVVKQEPAHVFQTGNAANAYLIDTDHGQVWTPAGDIQVLCAKVE